VTGPPKTGTLPEDQLASAVISVPELFVNWSALEVSKLRKPAAHKQSVFRVELCFVMVAAIPWVLEFPGAQGNPLIVQFSGNQHVTQENWTFFGMTVSGGKRKPTNLLLYRNVAP